MYAFNGWNLLAAHGMKITFKENVLSDGSLIRRILSVND